MAECNATDGTIRDKLLQVKPKAIKQHWRGDVNALVIWGASGTYYALAVPQLRREIEKHMPDAVWE